MLDLLLMSMVRDGIGCPLTCAMGFGIRDVSSLNLVSMPPHKIAVFIITFLADCMRELYIQFA